MVPLGCDRLDRSRTLSACNLSLSFIIRYKIRIEVLKSPENVQIDRSQDREIKA